LAVAVYARTRKARRRGGARPAGASGAAVPHQAAQVDNAGVRRNAVLVVLALIVVFDVVAVVSLRAGVQMVAMLLVLLAVLAMAGTTLAARPRRRGPGQQGQ
jgi:hypothetical protein